MARLMFLNNLKTWVRLFIHLGSLSGPIVGIYVIILNDFFNTFKSIYLIILNQIFIIGLML